MHLDRVDVSVVVAAWNAETFLQGSIDSALAQDGVTIEVIVANDASTDGTEALVRSLAERDPRIRLVSNTVNQGPAAARNTAIAAATGAWIAVLDADDRLLPGRLARLLSFARARDADVVFDLIGEVDEEGREIPDPRPLPFDREERWDLPRWILDNQPGQRMLLTGYLKPLIRRAALTQHGVSYREELRNSEDYALIAELLAQGRLGLASAGAGISLHTARRIDLAPDRPETSCATSGLRSRIRDTSRRGRGRSRHSDASGETDRSPEEHAGPDPGDRGSQGPVAVARAAGAGHAPAGDGPFHALDRRGGPQAHRAAPARLGRGGIVLRAEARSKGLTVTLVPGASRENLEHAFAQLLDDLAADGVLPTGKTGKVLEYGARFAAQKGGASRNWRLIGFNT